MIFLISGEAAAWFLAVIILAFFVFHVWLMVKAMTTVEFCEKSVKKKGYDTSLYSLGLFDNICNVLGPSPLLWLVPFASLPSGAGMSFKDSGSAATSDAQRSWVRVEGQTVATDDSRAADNAEAGAGASLGYRDRKRASQEGNLEGYMREKKEAPQGKGRFPFGINPIIER